MFSSLAILLLIQTTLALETWISVGNGGSLGKWGPKKWCPPDTTATGFSLKILVTPGAVSVSVVSGISIDTADIDDVSSATFGWYTDHKAGNICADIDVYVEQPLGVGGDNTGLNAIRLHCAEPLSQTTVQTISSFEGRWGEWTNVSWCSIGRLISFALQVEEYEGEEDNTGANSIMMQCSDYKVFTGQGSPWGDYGFWSDICPQGICGIMTRVESPQGRNDDTALNNVRFGCCNTEKQ